MRVVQVQVQVALVQNYGSFFCCLWCVERVGRCRLVEISCSGANLQDIQFQDFTGRLQLGFVALGCCPVYARCDVPVYAFGILLGPDPGGAVGSLSFVTAKTRKVSKMSKEGFVE